jgi:hypothetical protein
MAEAQGGQLRRWLPTKEGISFVTAVLALATTIANSCGLVVQGRRLTSQRGVLDQQQKQLADQQQELQGMRDLAATMVLNLVVISPRDGETVPAVYDGMRGTFRGSIPPGYALWVLARDSSAYYLMYPRTQVVHASKTWSQTNVRLATRGEWELELCIANPAASAWLQNRADRQDWSGFPSLPGGLEIVRSVRVLRN